MTFPEFLRRSDISSIEAARKLLGSVLIREFNDGTCAKVRIVETEAYDQDDPASHTFHGKSQRNWAMFEAGGIAYIYFTYGMHYCVNIVCGREGYGSGVLVRAAEPIEGEEYIAQRRSKARGVNMTNGPAKLTKALEIDKSLYAHDLSTSPLRLVEGGLHDDEFVLETPRIGISKAVEDKRRFVIAHEKTRALNPYVSEQRFTRTFLV
ncbi:DNA-3-methyladenine glycosylase [Alloscardovia theropitheci]|uniref:Putative 3-methyladenine DNA glycosylase n=1 Tax=Alloscardovia theropitheci TaxID=2496842 RepID=A0A4R0QVP6_9BIFI|nr:DNA-3-methyladenine glycosylase [Alloscardovia theropitheci]TCD54317.1 DNA-3-methyladenine glycosylase [Alloscardovia theropitheci]